MFLLKRNHYRLLLEEEKKTDKLHQVEMNILKDKNKCLSYEIKGLQAELHRVKGENNALKSEVEKQSAIEQENRQLKAENKKLFNQPYANYKRAYIDHHMTQIEKSANCGCGCYYEIYEERRQDGIANFIASNRPALSKYDRKYIKSEYDYDPNFKPYTEIDKETGEELNIWDIVRREQT